MSTEEIPIVAPIPPKQRPFNLPAGAWVAIIVGFIMTATGVIFDIDAKSVHGQYDLIAEDVKVNSADMKALLVATTQNTTNIGSLTVSIHDLGLMMQNHIIGEMKR
jgi:hypothetical protein